MEQSVSGRGNGLISSLANALEEALGGPLDIIDYSEHAIGHGTDARAAAYVECRVGEGPILFGVGISRDVATASVRAILSAANKGAVDAPRHRLTLTAAFLRFIALTDTINNWRDCMTLPAIFEKLRLPVIGSPLFIVSGPELVIAQCKAGVVGSFPALNARPAGAARRMAAPDYRGTRGA